MNDQDYTEPGDQILEGTQQGKDWLENSPVCTKIIDTDFNLKYMSHAGVSALKIDNVDDHYGQPYPFYFFAEGSKEATVKNLQKVKDTLQGLYAEMPVLDTEGNELWFYAAFSPILKEDGTLDYIMVVSTNITDRKNAEKKLAQKNKEIAEQNKRFEVLNAELQQANSELILAKEQAEESEKLKSSFLANMSHEIRTPLNSILGFTNVLRTNNNLNEEERDKYFGYVESGGQRLLRLISDVVDISKIDANQMTIDNAPCDLNNLLRALDEQLQIQIDQSKNKLKFSAGLDDDESHIIVDATRLAQVLSNLVENAAKFTITGLIEFGYELEKDKLKFFVKDEGLGIRTEDQEMIFDRFRQSENQITKSGTGLGLSVSKNLVDLMGGEMWVDSELGSGSSFYFTIPYNRLEAKIEKNTESKLTSNAKKRTILIAEDEQMNYEYLVALLEEENYNILHAADGNSAVEISQNDDSIDLILMDIRMPGIDGFEATKKIRESGKTLPIIAQSAFAMSEDKNRAMASGFTEYLEKPISRKQLWSVLDVHLK